MTSTWSRGGRELGISSVTQASSMEAWADPISPNPDTTWWF
ncbi:hypothetical protein [Streptomyces sp. NBC_00829]|nr:hypothetical protein OG293_36525 [Streptomyces sp. NBC_00829]